MADVGEPVVLQLTHLRMTALRYYPEFNDTDQSFAATYGFLRDRLESAVSLSTFQYQGELRAAWVESYEDSAHFGAAVTLVLPLADPCDAVAIDWLKAEIHRRIGTFADNTELLLDAPYAVLLPDLVRAGLHIESLILHGESRKALDILGREPVDFSPFDLVCRPMVDRPTATAVVKLQERLFRANPQYGWFVALPGHLDAKHLELLQELDDGSPFRCVLFRKGRVLGTFAFTPTFDHPCWGQIASVEVMLDPEIQGQGIGLLAYRHMLLAMENANITWFRGGTSHPAVLKLSERMGRQVRAWEIRFGVPTFPEGHFRYPKEGW